jgi:hypothetical protein
MDVLTPREELEREQEREAEIKKYRAIRPSRQVELAVQAWISERRRSRRPPETSAILLAYYVALYDRNWPVPSRPVLTVVLGDRNGNPMSLNSLDAAKNAALYNGEIVQQVRTTPAEPSDYSHRVWVTAETYFLPCQELIDVVHAAQAAQNTQTVAPKMRKRA